MYRFTNKVVVITGAGTGIGFEIAQQFIIEGAQVILNDFDANLANNAAQKLGTNCTPIAGDASNVTFIYHLIEKTIQIFGKIDIAIANAGLTLSGDFLNFDEGQFDKIMNLNLKGSFFLAQAFAKQIKAQNSGGKFIVLSSTVGTQSFPGMTAYGMSKAALKMMARALIKDLSPLGININCVGPGATVTERTAKDDINYAQNWANVIPIGQVAYPIDIAKTVLFLCSDDARHIQGQTIMVDGGWSGVSNIPS